MTYNSIAQPANDNFAGASDVTSLINSCSANNAYTTIAATADLNAGSCWNNGGPLQNVWFKFTAPASGQINIIVDVANGVGSQRRTQLALWQSDGTTEIACDRYTSGNADDVTLGVLSLTPSNTYYFSVDVFSASYDGTFKLCLSDQVDYDFYEGATDVTALINTCSADAVYTTVGASPDKNAGSCWNNSGPQVNRWFKFTAPASGNINITVDRGGTKGNQRRTQLALWQADGITEVACDRYTSSNGDDVSLGALGLTPGNTYYISVDAFSTSYDGTFTLCLDDQVDYDFYEGAIDVTSLINSCSADAAYTTIGASPDKNAGSCWNNSGPQLNRWFKFTAPASGIINVTVDVNGTKGTQRRTQLALWESDGVTEVACDRYTSSNADDVSLGALALTPGNTYYISVDAYSTSHDGTFTLCLDDQVDYDFYEGAVDVTSLINSCSADAAYSTIGASPDKNAGSCWNNSGPQLNRWFKFTAPASGIINVTVDVNGTKGTQRRTQLALWESDGVTEVACDRYTSSNADDVSLGALALTPGNTYYISVDAYSTSYDGTFTLCLDDQVDYDFYEGAIDVTSLINSCSADAAYSTIGASPDKNAGSCWNNSGPQLNRWFKFTAPANGVINITIDRGGTKGTQQRTQLALWQADGVTEVACDRYTSSNGDDVSLGTLGLTPGNTYYISVDAFNTSYDGTFTLCLDDQVDYDFYEGAIDVTSLINSCSADAIYTTIGASPDKNAGSCWNNSGPQLNRWFKFTAPASGIINVTVDVNGTKGTQRRTQLALWQSDGVTEVACDRYTSSNADDVSLGALGLTPGNTYYISVDAFNTSYDGTFTLCLDDQVDYDFYEGAIAITDINNWCSADAQYTTIGASPDQNAGSCWNNSGPQVNRWFKFTASATGAIRIHVEVNGTKGTQRRTQIALWESDGITEVACSRYTASNADPVTINSLSLVPGNTYYISVDAFSTSYDGTFTLCVDDAVDYDYYEGAIELTDLNNWCSADAAYTTIGASADRNAGSCWNNSGPVLNRWFKFTAISSNVTFTVDIGGTKGSQRRTQLALWQNDGTTEVACSRYVSNGDDVSISNGTLVIGNVYYISVDAFSTSYDGSFTFCIDNVDETYYSRADGDWTNPNSWSIVGFGGPAASSYPQVGDIANIQDNDIAVTSNEVAAEVNLTVSADHTNLTLSGATLAVSGNLSATNASAGINAAISVTNGAISIGNDFSLNKSGSTGGISLSSTNSTWTIGNDLNINSSAGTTAVTVSLNSSSSLNIGNDLLLSNTGGPKSTVTIDASTLTVTNDIVFTASADNLVELALTNAANLYLKGNIVQGTPAYGILNSTGSSTVHYNSSNNLQTLASTTGSGTGDAINYENLTINNSRITTPQITLAGIATVSGALTLVDGEVLSTSANLLTLSAGSSTSGASINSFINGPIKKIGNTDFEFPVGDNNFWQPISIANLTGDAATEFTAEYFGNTYSDVSNLKSPDPNGDLYNVSSVEYWNLVNSGTASSADITLFWKNQARSDINNGPDLQIARYTGSEWENLGQASINFANPGSISVSGQSSFGDFTFGSISSTYNPLPVQLVEFIAIANVNTIVLRWSTASEFENAYFSIEKSTDGENWRSLSRLDGVGNSNTWTEYEFIDKYPLKGYQYYRLKQVDIDGTSTYSRIISVKHHGTNNVVFDIFPVPLRSGNTLTISTNFQLEIKELRLVSLAGSTSLVAFQKLLPGKYKATVNDQPGIYIIIVQTENGEYRQKLIIN